jgi:putative transposase
MGITPKASWPWVRTLLHSVYDQPDAKAVHEQYDGSWRAEREAACGR